MSRITPDRPHDLVSRLRRLAENLHWTWSPSTQRLFASIDPASWDARNHAPLWQLSRLSHLHAPTDTTFAAALQHAEGDLANYLNAKTWFDGLPRQSKPRHTLVAYFSAEFALHESLPLYAGGLGVLAGDHLKAASDLGIPLVGVGLFYRNGYYRQRFLPDGSTAVAYDHLNPALAGLIDTRKSISVPVGDRIVHARIWKAQVGRVPLFLLDAGVPDNRPNDRALSDHLYGGDRDYRIRQEILLGVGGVLALQALRIYPSLFHLNEGHTAFCALERLRRLMLQRRRRDAAINAVRATTVFTTHTPVPAGHDRFSPSMMRKYFKTFANDVGDSLNDLLALGREDPRNQKEDFCMTVLALNLSAKVNGVSRLHGRVSREMWQHAYHAPSPDDVPINHVTNGVHTQSWLDPAAAEFYARYIKPDWNRLTPDQSWWSRSDRIPPAEFWALRNDLRRTLVHEIRRRLALQLQARHASARDVARAASYLDEHALTIGFARRFATYKRAPLVFHDPKRLARILNNPRRPVQILFAGKAHPADTAGQEFARRIFRYADLPLFRGRIILLENYDMALGRALTAGCDVWLNNPIRPQEASGTSGMKSPLNGGLNCSISDGWWPECFNGRNGWTIGDGREFKTQAAQDRYDANCIYEILEQSMIPLFYRRNSAGVPLQWVNMMIESLKSVAGPFSAHRMLAEYTLKCYLRSPKS